MTLAVASSGKDTCAEQLEPLHALWHVLFACAGASAGRTGTLAVIPPVDASPVHASYDIIIVSH